MARLPRPYIPLAVRVQVATRQAIGQGWSIAADHMPKGSAAVLNKFLCLLFGQAKVELHHRPALVNRRRYVRNGKTFYDPPANDPDFLVYLAEDDHDIETRVRGLHGQHSDLALVRKRKRKERKAKRPKTRWASRPLRSASRWPKRRKQWASK